MDMKINSNLIIQLRKQRAWSQQHLSDICGLSLRTIQRVENNGTGSFETLKSLAATFEMSENSLVVAEKSESTVQSHSLLLPSTKHFNLKKALTTSAILLSLLGSFVLTSATTAASDVKIEAMSMTMSEDRTTDTFVGNVQIFIPRHVAFTILSGNEQAPSVSESHVTIKTEIGSIVIANAEILVQTEGLRISADKAVLQNSSKS